MTPDERQMLADLFERVRSTGSSQRDPQAEALINDAVRAVPFAPYVLTQTVLVQQQALENAAKRISELEAQAAPPQQETSFLGGITRSIFGGSAPTPPRSSYDASAYQRQAAPDPYAGRSPTGYAAPQGGPWGGAQAPARSGGGFMSGAVQTAAGVAGGMLAANALSNMFSGHSGMLEHGGEVVNNSFGGSGRDADQRAADAQQDRDQDQDDVQDAGDGGGGGGDGGSLDA